MDRFAHLRDRVGIQMLHIPVSLVLKSQICQLFTFLYGERIFHKALSECFVIPDLKVVCFPDNNYIPGYLCVIAE